MVKWTLALRGGRLALAAAALFAVAAGIAYAIPGADGVIHACYRTSLDDQKGQVRVVSDPGNCRSNEAPIQWSQSGPAGSPGPPGPPGQDGEDGEDGQDGADGDPFSGTFTSPNGQYSLRVTDAGIELSGPGTSLTLDAAGVRVTSATQLRLQAGASLTLDAAGTLTAEAGGALTVDGSAVVIRPSGCRPAARIADPIAGTAAAGGAVTGSIVAGSPTVCIG